MNRLCKVTAVAMLPFAVGGCATVINGTSQDYKWRRNLRGAKVTLSNGQSCVAPCKISLKRRNDLTATLSLKVIRPKKFIFRAVLAVQAWVTFSWVGHWCRRRCIKWIYEQLISASFEREVGGRWFDRRSRYTGQKGRSYRHGCRA